MLRSIKITLLALFAALVSVSDARADEYIVGVRITTPSYSASADRRGEDTAKHLFGYQNFIRAITSSVSVVELSKEELRAFFMTTSPEVNKIEYIEPNFKRFASIVPNDEYTTNPFVNQWAPFGDPYQGIRATDAWDLFTGSDDNVIGVIDTGVDYSHPDFRNNIFSNSFEIPGNGLDDDGNGYIDDVRGYDFVNRDNTPRDDFQFGGYVGHGTHVAGIIGARGNNTIGVTGINWRCKILPLKVLDNNGSGDVAAIAEAIYYAVGLKIRHGVQIRALNLSFGASDYSRTEEDAIRTASAVDMNIVAAAGNEGANNDLTPVYPAGYQIGNLLSVGAIDQSGNRASFSNFGHTAVDIMAPGVDILSTIPHGDYRSYSGTSMSTPQVTGVLALLRSYRPELSASQAHGIILNSARVLPPLSGLVASGALDAALALPASSADTKLLSLAGRVVTRRGTPVPGVSVSSNFGGAITNNQGLFFFDGIPQGSAYTLALSKPRYAFISSGYSGILNSDSIITIEVDSPNFKVKGALRYSFFHDRRDIRFQLYEAGVGRVRTASSKSGKLVIRGLEEGRYVIRPSQRRNLVTPTRTRFKVLDKDRAFHFRVQLKR